MLDFSKAKLLTFDCYGTLIDWESGIFSVLRPCARGAWKIHISESELLALYGELNRKIESWPVPAISREVLRCVVRALWRAARFCADAGRYRRPSRFGAEMAALARHGCGAAAARDEVPAVDHFEYR